VAQAGVRARRQPAKPARHGAIQKSAAAPASVSTKQDSVLKLFNPDPAHPENQAEEIRDAVLQVSGNLNFKMGGMPAVPPLESEELFGIIGRPENAWMVSPDSNEHRRRSIYLLRRRTFQQPMMEAFDAPDGVLSCSRRNESTTAPQSLALLNSRFMMRQAEVAASAVETAEQAFEQILGRAPSNSEKAAASEFLERQSARLGSRRAALAEVTRSLMNTNEFLYVD
jgi:hypothetical protein